MAARVIRLGSAPSTNDLGKELLRAGEPHGTVIIAARQTRGRGQRGRRWASPPGGLWASLLVRPKLEVTQAGLLNIASVVAAGEAGAAVSGVSIRIKWPNDLLVQGRKVGGVLVETSAARGVIAWATIGVGVNANVSCASLPAGLRASAASLAEEAGRVISLDALLGELCDRTQRGLDLIESGAVDEILAAWRALDATPGREVRSSRGERIGIAQGIDSLGRLVVTVARGESLPFPTTRGIIIA